MDEEAVAVIVGPSTITINHNIRFLIAQPDVSIAAGRELGISGIGS